MFRLHATRWDRGTMSRILRNPGNDILPSMGKNIDQWTTIHQIGRGVLGTRYRVTNKNTACIANIGDHTEIFLPKKEIFAIDPPNQRKE
jgi:hypothetical protein